MINNDESDFRQLPGPARLVPLHIGLFIFTTRNLLRSMHSVYVREDVKTVGRSLVGWVVRINIMLPAFQPPGVMLSGAPRSSSDATAPPFRVSLAQI